MRKLPVRNGPESRVRVNPAGSHDPVHTVQYRRRLAHQITRELRGERVHPAGRRTGTQRWRSPTRGPRPRWGHEAQVVRPRLYLARIGHGSRFRHDLCRFGIDYLTKNCLPVMETSNDQAAASFVLYPNSSGKANQMPPAVGLE
jgi:hypothetical protein